MTKQALFAHELLQLVAEELRAVDGDYEFSNASEDVAYYAALSSVATCIEAVLDRARLQGHSENDAIRQVKAIKGIVRHVDVT